MRPSNHFCKGVDTNVWGALTYRLRVRRSMQKFHLCASSHKQSKLVTPKLFGAGAIVAGVLGSLDTLTVMGN